VDIERLFGKRPDGVGDGRTYRDVRHKMAIHHVDVDPVGASSLDRANLVAQPGEIGRKNRRRNDERAGHFTGLQTPFG
jgi:hypothetical protein